MYQALLGDVTFYRALLKLDEEIAAEWRSRGCVVCGAPIDVANYPRKPRTVLGSAWPESDSRRLSLCCRAEGCRKRNTPPSVRFLGRRIYFGAVVLIATFLLGGTTSIDRISKELGPSRRTLVRWRRWWTRSFPRSESFVRLRSRWVPAVKEDGLPCSLLDRLRGSERERTVLALEIMKPLTIG